MIPLTPGQPPGPATWQFLIKSFIINEFIPKHIPQGLTLKQVGFDLIWYFVIAKCYFQSVENPDAQYHILAHQTPEQIRQLLTGVLTGLGYYAH